MNPCTPQVFCFPHANSVVLIGNTFLLYSVHTAPIKRTKAVCLGSGSISSRLVVLHTSELISPYKFMSSPVFDFKLAHIKDKLFRDQTQRGKHYISLSQPPLGVVILMGFKTNTSGLPLIGKNLQ